jgi:hypothetical protein
MGPPPDLLLEAFLTRAHAVLIVLQVSLSVLQRRGVLARWCWRHGPPTVRRQPPGAGRVLLPCSRPPRHLSSDVS